MAAAGRLSEEMGVDRERAVADAGRAAIDVARDLAPEAKNSVADAVREATRPDTGPEGPTRPEGS